MAKKKTAPAKRPTKKRPAKKLDSATTATVTAVGTAESTKDLREVIAAYSIRLGQLIAVDAVAPNVWLVFNRYGSPDLGCAHRSVYGYATGIYQLVSDVVGLSWVEMQPDVLNPDEPTDNDRFNAEWARLGDVIESVAGKLANHRPSHPGPLALRRLYNRLDYEVGRAMDAAEHDQDAVTLEAASSHICEAFSCATAVASGLRQLITPATTITGNGPTTPKRGVWHSPTEKVPEEYRNNGPISGEVNQLSKWYRGRVVKNDRMLTMAVERGALWGVANGSEYKIWFQFSEKYRETLGRMTKDKLANYSE